MTGARFYLKMLASNLILMRSDRSNATWLVMILTGVLALSAWAHTPFGSSVQVVAGPEIQVDIKMGMAASTAFLRIAGLSAEAIEEAHQPRTSAGGFLMLSPDLISRLFEVRHAGQPLRGASLQIASDGKEVLYRIAFPNAPSGELEFTAKFLNDLPNFDQSLIVAIDEQGGEIGAALLSGTKATLRVSVPEPATPAGVVSEPVTNSVADVAPPIQEPVFASTKPVALPHPTFGEFFKLGVEHILTGIDHLLFLGALLLCVRRIRPMLAVITCFTVAHSITLGLSAFELVAVSPRLVEPLIAASIMVVGMENLVREAQSDRYWLAGGFGLIHGFGFASALRETGLGRAGSDMVMPLFSFNLGVELGQIAVAAVVIPILLGFRRQSWFERRGMSSLSALIILISGYWLVQRVFFAS